VQRRFVSVRPLQNKWWAYAYLQRQNFTLGGYYTEEEAAKAVDRAIIYTAGHCTSRRPSVVQLASHKHSQIHEY